MKLLRMDSSSGGDSADRSLRAGAPANLPANPSLSYNPRTMALGIPPEDGDDFSAPTFGRDLSETRAESPQPIDAARESRQAEALGFTLLRLVGRGGMGEVWEAIQRRLWRRVAVKRMRHAAGGSTLGDDATMRRTFEWEAMTSALLDHPNIVPVYDLGIDESGIPLLAMKLVKGHGWNKLLDADMQALDAESHLARHLPILSQVAQAVAFAHSRGVVHRDLKPSQVMIGEFGEVLLMDWGLAVMVGAKPEFPSEFAPGRIYPDLDSCENPAGTPGYMAPEQTEPTSARIGPWTDVYLLGGMLFNVMTGRRPHPGDSSAAAFRNAAEGIVTPWEEAAPGRHPPEELRSLVGDALNPATDSRPTAREFIDRLQDYMTGAGRRRESVAITSQLAGETHARTYAAFVNGLTRLGQAQSLWPDNPECAALRERLVGGYAELALASGDLKLARAQGERMASVPAREGLLTRVDEAERRLKLQRLRLRQFAALTAILVVLVFAGGAAFTYQLKKANDRTGDQLRITTEARIAESDARRAAQDELDRATLLLADALIEQDRRDEAIAHLYSIPEEKRFWEWGFLLTRAMQDLWEVPYRYFEFSPTKRLVIARNEQDGLCLLKAETGERIAILGSHEVAGLRFKFSPDESMLAIYTVGLPASLHDTRTGARLARFEGEGAVTSLEISPDKRQLAVGLVDGRLLLLDVAGGATRMHWQSDRAIGDLFWRGDKLVAVCHGEVWRLDMAKGKRELLHAQAPDGTAYWSYSARSDPSREWFAFGYERNPLMAGRVESGGLKAFPGSHFRFHLCQHRPWIVTTGGGAEPGVIVWNLESGERVLWDLPAPLVAASEPTRETRPPSSHNISLSESEDVVLCDVDPTGRRQLFTFPELRHVGFPAVLDYPGNHNIELMPSGNAAWVVFDDKTVIRPIGAPYPGIRIPGHTSSIGGGDAYTSALAMYWFEQRDTEHGDLQFVGGRMFSLYMGGRLTADLARIYIPGIRGENFTVEKADRSSSRVLGSYTWGDGVIGTFALHPDREQMVGIRADQSRLASWSLAGVEKVPQFELDAGDGDAFIGASFDATGGRLYVRTALGNLLTLNPDTGAVASTIHAHKGPVNGLLAVRGTGHIATYGEDGWVRLWADGADRPAHAINFGFPVAGAAITPDGKRILAWPAVGNPDFRTLPEGREICRLDRTDFPMANVRFLGGDARIVSSAGGAARFWDTRTGRESYAMAQGFGGISADERRMIHMTEEWEGMLIDIAPSRTSDLPGDASMSLRERLDLWKVARYRRWSIAQQKVDLGAYWYEAAAVPGDVAEVPRGTVMDIFIPLAAGAPSDAAGLTEYLAHEGARFYMRWFDDGARDTKEQFDDKATVLLRRSLIKSPDLSNGPAGLAAIVLGATRGRIVGDLSHLLRKGDPGHVSHLFMPIDSMARVYIDRGEREQAAAVARWLWAVRAALGFVPGETGETLARLGVQPPDPPPPGLGALPAVGLPGRFLQAAALDGPPLDTAKARAHLQAAREEYAAAIEAYLAATPEPEWDELIRRARADPAWQPIEPDIPASQYFTDLARRAASLRLKGENLEVLRDREAARIDDAFAFVTKRGSSAPPPTDAGSKE